MRRSRHSLLLLPMLAVVLGAAAIAIASNDGAPKPPGPRPVSGPPVPERVTAPPPFAPSSPAPSRERSFERIRWRRSVAVGYHTAGRLVRGVRLPSEGERFFTWDPVKHRSPDRWWRRFGTDRLVRLLLRVAREFHAAHPDAPRMAIGDLSRPRGGDFGPRFGYIGHASHQNGLDADVYYPRADGRERAPKYASQIDRPLSQWLVDRFVERGAIAVFVGPNTGLKGPPQVVQPLVNHDNHLHVRIR